MKYKICAINEWYRIRSHALAPHSVRECILTAVTTKGVTYLLRRTAFTSIYLYGYPFMSHYNSGILLVKLSYFSTERHGFHTGP